METRISNVSEEMKTSRGNTYYTAEFSQRGSGPLSVQRSCSRSFFKDSNGNYEGVPRQAAIQAAEQGTDVSSSAEVVNAQIQPATATITDENGERREVRFTSRTVVKLADESTEDAIRAVGHEPASGEHDAPEAEAEASPTTDERAQVEPQPA